MKNFWQEFKTPIITVIFVFIGFFAYTKLAGPIPFFVNSVTTTKTDLFSSNGEGQVTAIPDTATIYVGVTQTSLTVTDAKNKTNAIVNKLIADIKKLGISDKDIKTTNYSVNPDYTQGGVEPLGAMPIRQGGNDITGYTVSQSFEIDAKPTDKINKVIDTVTSDGANLVGGVTFKFSDGLQNQLENQARQQAVNNAKSKAESLATAAGIHLGNIVNVTENNNQPGILPMMGAGVIKSETAVTSPPTNVTPGENTVAVDVVIYYETY